MKDYLIKLKTTNHYASWIEGQRIDDKDVTRR